MVGSLLMKAEKTKEEAAMLTYSEGIVGLWLVPVILCIIMPLIMLCVWFIMQLFKKTGDKIEQVEKSAQEERSETITKAEVVSICTLF